VGTVRLLRSASPTISAIGTEPNTHTRSATP
jgi:hypothetical protein